MAKGLSRTPTPRAGIRDVAAAAGVSVSAVSLVLNRRSNVSAATTARVRQAMKRLGYTPAPRPHRPGPRPRPHGAARPAGRIAVLLLGITPADILAPVYNDVVAGVWGALKHAGYTPELRQVLNDAETVAALRDVSANGALFFGRSAGVPALLGRETPDLPAVVMMGPVLDNSPLDHVTYDDRAAGRMAAQYLLSRGHTRLAVVGTFGLRTAAFAETATAAGATVEELADGLPLQGIVHALATYRPRLTGAFVPMDSLTASLYPLLAQAGIKPNVNIDIVSCNNEKPLLDALLPRPAVVDIHASLVGARAAEQLLWRLHHPGAPRLVTLVEPTLVPASTERAARQDRAPMQRAPRK